MNQPRYVDISDAARQLRVPAARVQEMLDVGDLSGAKFGAVWLVESRDVERRRATTAPRGRPLAPHNAWAVLALLEGRPPALPEDAVRFVRRHVERPIDELAPALRQRSARQETTTTEVFAADLGHDPRVVLGGSVAARVHRLVGGDVHSLDAYVRRRDAGELIDDMRRGTGTVPIVVRIVDDDLWPFAPGERWVGPAVAVVDLWDAGITDVAAARPVLPGQ